MRNTAFTLPLPEGQKPTIQQIYAGVVADEIRNQMLFEDVVKALEAGRSPLLLTERKDHAAMLAEKLTKWIWYFRIDIG